MVENDDVSGAQSALNDGASANAEGDAGLGERHTLITAHAHEDTRMVRMLLTHGADPTLALTVALDTDEAKSLLHLGAKIDSVPGDSGLTPLGEQASDGRPDIVRLLLLNGGDPTVKDREGWTAIERAEYASKNHPEDAAQYSLTIRLLKMAESHRLTGK